MDYFRKVFVLSTVIVLCSLPLIGKSNAQTLAPDGTWVGGSTSTLAPDGTWVGGTETTLAPNGTWVGNGR